MSEFLGGVGVVLLAIVLAIILIPLLVGLGVAFLLGFNGLIFYGVIILIAFIIWSILGVVFYV